MTDLLPHSDLRTVVPDDVSSGCGAAVMLGADSPRTRALLASLHGRTGVAPFIASPEVVVLDLLDGRAAAGFTQVGRWAISPGEPVAPRHLFESALGEYLDRIACLRLRPAFMAVSDPTPFTARGMAVQEVADEAVVDLASFTLAGSARANVRHAVSSARRHGLMFAAFHRGMTGQLREISESWLATKRGGELGFTLSRHDDVAYQLEEGATDLWTVLDASGQVQAWCTWRHYLGGTGRVIDVMRRRPDAPNPAMDFLLASSLETYRDQGLRLASLASVPRPHGELAERIYPTKTLRAYKQKFAPRWERRWLAVPKPRQAPFAMMAISRAYCPGGLGRALRRNG